MNKKYIIVAFIAGIILTAFAYHAYTVYQLKKIVAVHGQVLQQIVDLINKSQPSVQSTAIK